MLIRPWVDGALTLISTFSSNTPQNFDTVNEAVWDVSVHLPKPFCFFTVSRRCCMCVTPVVIYVLVSCAAIRLEHNKALAASQTVNQVFHSLPQIHDYLILSLLETCFMVKFGLGGDLNFIHGKCMSLYLF